MTGLAHRWSARTASAVAAALLIAGSTAGTTFAAEADRAVVLADTPVPTVGITAKYAVVATTHPDTQGCQGFEVTGTGTATGAPIDSGTWTQDEVACTATIPGKYDIKGTAVMEESDGDKLNISYQLTAPLTDATLVHPTGTFKITGGTGEYEFAIGGGKMNARVNLLDHDNVTCKLTGMIEYLG
ncbi:hypothetical protein G5C60_46455 [Streptomyces sp. HC44]|uniref:Uncharacterized protein n=1 Tax=Streptomyces scabichelini TaxID=2711217 RepID=A0A6G4VLJ2_9ACTN|nr:hypothetical protein [Streptomyces scabichelini]NGO14841.1 hypothetical protein [Streptomyces scabichelini]